MAEKTRCGEMFLQDAFKVFGKTTEFTTDLLENSLNNNYQGSQ